MRFNPEIDRKDRKGIDKVRKMNPGTELTDNEAYLINIVRRAGWVIISYWIYNNISSFFRFFTNEAREEAQGEWTFWDTYEHYFPKTAIKKYAETLSNYTINELITEQHIIVVTKRYNTNRAEWKLTAWEDEILSRDLEWDTRIETLVPIDMHEKTQRSTSNADAALKA